MHIRDVLRMQTGEQCILSVEGMDYVSEIEEIGRDRIIFRVFRQVENLAEPEVDITLYQGVPKGDKMELIIQKCVELGVNRIIPVQCERSVAKLTKENTDKKITRWQRQAEEASKQCGRGRIAQIGQPVRVSDITTEGELAILFWEKETENRLKQALSSGVKRISIFVGPEGGISDGEADILREKGFVTVTLGTRILRTETAGLAAISSIMYHYDELG